MFQGASECAELGGREFLGARRRCDASAFQQLSDRDLERFEAGAQHLAALAKRSSGDAFEREPFCRRKWIRARQDLDQARCDLGRGNKSSGRYIEQDTRLSNPLEQHGQPSIRLAARSGDQALGGLALEHQGQALILSDPLDPPDEERRGGVVGEVGDDLAGWLRKRRWIEFERVGGDDLEVLGIGRSKLAQRCQTAPVVLDRDDPACAAAQQRPRQTAWTGADLDNRCMVEPTGCPRDPARQVEVEQEILTETFVSDNAVTRDYLSQWRQSGCGCLA